MGRKSGIKAALLPGLLGVAARTSQAATPAAPCANVWHQTWVDDTGLLLTLEGRWGGKSMILEGPGQRITRTPNADGSVRQLWESADDKGVWTVVIDGKYTKK